MFFAASDNDDIRRKLASITKEPKIFQYLLDHENDPRVLGLMAINKNLPDQQYLELLNKFADNKNPPDEMVDIIELLLARKRTPKEFIRFFIDSNNEHLSSLAKQKIQTEASKFLLTKLMF